MKKIVFVWMSLFSFTVILNASEGNTMDYMSWYVFASLSCLVVIIAFAVYYYQMIKVKKIHQEILDKRQILEEDQHLFLSNISEDIHNLTKMTHNSRKEVIDVAKSVLPRDEFEKVVKSENRLINTTESLIEFLRLKSKKIKIKKEKFNLNNVLNEVSGILSINYPDCNIELIFDIDNSVPRYLTGDSLQLGQILVNFIKNIVDNGENSEIIIEISRLKTSLLSREMIFKIIDTNMVYADDKLSVFTRPQYDEEREEYIGLDLFVTHELIGLMQGRASVENIGDENMAYILTLPFSVSDWSEKRKYRLPRKEMLAKKVLLSDNNESSAKAIKKLLEYFKYRVAVVSIKDFKIRSVDFAGYDMLILNQELFKFHINTYIKSIKEKSELKVVSISSIFSSKKIDIENGIVDMELKKPLSQERIFEMIVELYAPKHKADTSKKDKKIPKSIKVLREICRVHRENFTEKENIKTDNFVDFASRSILVVEDNIINQKILSNVLGKSKMKITIANNGQEAVDFVIKENKEYDLILMDINMPIMDGYEATSIIRRDIRFSNLPIVALTALVLDAEISKMFGHGISGYLSKPLNIGRLYSAFEYFLEKDTGSESVKINENEQIPELDGIDLNQGIEYADGNETLYLEVLSEFLSAYGDTDRLVRQLIDEHKFEQAQILCMDMRSLSKTIGAHRMHDVSDRMYKLFLYGNEHMAPKYAEAYGRELSTLKKSIQAYIKYFNDNKIY